MVVNSNGDVYYTDPLKRTPSADAAVIQYSYADSRPIASALVRCTPAHYGGKTWHVGGNNPHSPEHLTVEYKDRSGNHITTKHVDRNGRAC